VHIRRQHNFLIIVGSNRRNPFFILRNIAGIIEPAAIISLVGSGFRLVQDVSYRFAADSYASRRFGRVPALLMSVAFMHPTTLGEFEWYLNTWSEKEIIDWKNSHLAGCQSTAIAVSGAIEEPAL
jgi:hypothetical protein